MEFQNKNRDQILETLLARKAQAQEQNLEEHHALSYILAPLFNDRAELIANEQRALGDVADSMKLVEKYKAQLDDEDGEKSEGPMEPVELDAEAYLKGVETVSIGSLNAKNVYLSITNYAGPPEEEVPEVEVTQSTDVDLAKELIKRLPGMSMSHNTVTGQITSLHFQRV